MQGLEIEDSGGLHRRKVSYKFIAVAVLVLLLLVGAVILIVFLVRKHKDTSSETCASGPGYEAAKSYFRDPANGGRVTIPSQDFKKIVSACKGDVDRALLCVANYIAYEGTDLDSTGQRQVRFSPPPAAQHTVMSGYPVGACVLGGKTGTVYIGANFEFCSPLINTVHGEQCAVHNAAVHGEPTIRKLAVNAAPCGVCRQFLVETGSPDDLDVIFCSNDGKFVSSKLSDLLLESFGPENLGQKNTSLKHPVYHQVSDKDDDSQQIKEAKQMFRQAYAPYTHISEGVVLEFLDGQSAKGQTIENAAYNPGLSAFRGACSLAALKGYDMSKLSAVTHAFPSSNIARAGQTCGLPNTVANMKSIMESLYKSQTFSTGVGLTPVPIPLPPPASLARATAWRPMRLPL